MVSVLCAVCGSYGGRVVYPPPPRRQLALRDVLLGFLPVSKRTARLDSIPGEVLRANWSVSHQGPVSCVSAQLPFVTAALLNVLIEPALDLFKLGSTASNAAHQREFLMSRDVAPRRGLPPAMASLRTRIWHGTPKCGAPRARLFG